MDISDIAASAALLRHKEDVRAALFHYTKDDGINKDILDRIVNHVIDSTAGDVMSILIIPPPEDIGMVMAVLRTHTTVTRMVTWWHPTDPAGMKLKNTPVLQQDSTFAVTGYWNTHQDKDKFEAGPIGHFVRDSSVFVAPRKPRELYTLGEASCSSELPLRLPMQWWDATTSLEDWVFDIGCGSGAGAISAALAGRNSISIDISEEMVCIF